MEKSQIRQTAQKVWINELTSGIYKTSETIEPNYILTTNNKKISRVNIIAIVISKYINEDGTYSTLTIDDNSSKILIKTFKDDAHIIKNIEIGDIVLIIGKLKLNNNQLFILPEIVKKVNLSWLKLRKFELSEISKVDIKLQRIVEQPIIEEVTNISNTSRQKILNLIDKFESKEGVDPIEISKELQLNDREVKTVITELIKEGEIFEVKGKLKIMG